MLNNCLFYFAFTFLLLFSKFAFSVPACNIEKFSQYQMEYCIYKGKGPLLVLESAQGSNMQVWPESFLQQLNKFSEVLIYNRIGYQKSHYYQPRKLNVVTAKSISEQLNVLLARLKIKKPIIIVAHSISSIYAQYYIRNYPENIAGLVIIDGDSSFEPTVNSPFQSKTSEKRDSIGYLESAGFNQSMDQVNSSPPFPNIPLLVITATNHGSDKKTEELWQKLQEKLSKESSNGKQIIAYGSGHFIFKDNPSLVIDAIYRFILANKIS
jgi:hypothetical protein